MQMSYDHKIISEVIYNLTLILKQLSHACSQQFINIAKLSRLHYHVINL